MAGVLVWARVFWVSLLCGVRGGWRDERGATVAEYALVLVLVAVALIAVLTDLRSALEQKINLIITQIRGTS